MPGKDQTTFIKDPVARKRFWFRHVRAYLVSGKSAQQYSKEVGISFFSLRDWQTKFKNEHNSEWKSIVERAKQRSSDNKQSAPFVEVRLDESTASDLEVEERSSAWEISTPGGFKITMPADSNISEVVALIRRLREAQC